MALQGRLLSVAAVTPQEHHAMFALMQDHYEGVRRATFDADLAEKQWVIQVLDPLTGALCGFSTQMLVDSEVDGRPIKALFSGDTIIARQHWGDNALARIWGRLALSLIDRHAKYDLYWFLISKGYKTYRFLPVFFHEFFPRPETPMPPWARSILDELARRKFPGNYDPRLGVIRAHEGADRLRRGVADITLARLDDPYVRFFVERNPGFRDGDELCCLAPLTRENFTAAAYRVIGSTPAATVG